MSAPPAADAAATTAKPKSKKLLIIILAVVLLLVAGGVGLFIMTRHKASAENTDEHAAAAHAPAPPPAQPDPKAPPTFLPLDNMVVNLADPGGERMAQIGITIELADAKTAELVKQYLPAIRNGILLTLSQRTSAELLQREGKEKLARDIHQEVSAPLGYEVEPLESETPPKAKKTSKRKVYNPVRGVLFSSFIIQ